MIWGISATIGNLEEAKEVILSALNREGVIVKAGISKAIEVESVFPDEIEKYPWAGHLGIKLAHKIIPIIQQSRTTLIFINTRGMSETWYQTLLNVCPELAGSIALHHSSIDRDLRTWIEDNLHSGNLKAVVCTASLDLGVDFRPVETVIQVGSPKGVARFLQRAGRSGHSPDAISRIYFLPTHSLELLEAAALKKALDTHTVESRPPQLLCYDVLIQYLNTLAISEGFEPKEIFSELKTTFCFRELQENEWQQILHFITEGGVAMGQYDEFRKVEVEEGIYRIRNRKLAMRHRMHIGTIVSDAMMKVKFVSGGYVGVIEEYFISRLNPGDVFTLAGRHLEFVLIRDMTALVRKSDKKKAIVPSWTGGRMPLSANLGKILRRTLNDLGRRKLNGTYRKYWIDAQLSLTKAREEQKKKFEAEITNEYTDKPKELKQFKVLQKGFSGSNAAMAIEEAFSMDGWVKKAGNNYILEAGKFVGNQLEIKADQRERKLDIYMPYARSFNNNISLKIPEGYTIEGADKLNKSVKNECGGFESTAKIEGNTLLITYYKYYNIEENIFDML